MLYRVIRPLLFALPPEEAHGLMLKFLSIFELVFPYRKNEKKVAIRIMGINFPSRVGMAAGLDKNGDCIPGFARCGFGFIEVGTVTPMPQSGNEVPRIFRLIKHKAIINSMGFPNLGIDHLVKRLRSLRAKPVLGINLGKNATTPLPEAINDYLIGFERVYAYADYVTINISSPNTPGLRELQTEQYLFDFLTRLKQKQQQLSHEQARYVPLVVKISPDLAPVELDMMAQVFLGTEIDGVIVTNTTLSREGVAGDIHAEKPGGLSGAPLFEKSTEILRRLSTQLKGHIPIIASGGIMSVEDAKEKIAAGASVVQLYTGLIYEGPGLIKAIAKAID